MNERLNEYLQKNNIINKCQIGFRKKFRTADHLLVLKTLVDYYKSKRKPIFACFIDFRKAYDSVWREGLFLKLILNGCSRKFIRLMLNMYSSYNCSVKLEEGSTPFFKSQIGVKQGCNLSPTLFNFFINDLPDIFNRPCTPVTLNDTELSCLLYADDLVLLSESKAGLQNCLNKLVIKYWFRIKSPSFSNTLVGEAAKACMELKLKPTMFLRYTLQLCEEEDSILQNEVSNLQNEIFKSEKSVCHYVKRGLQNVFMRY